MKNIVMVIILIVIGSYSVQAKDTADTKIEGIEAEKVLLNGEIITKHYEVRSYFTALLKYKKKLYHCYVDVMTRRSLDDIYCVTVPN